MTREEADVILTRLILKHDKIAFTAINYGIDSTYYKAALEELKTAKEEVIQILLKV